MPLSFFFVEYIVMARSNASAVINWRIGAPCFIHDTSDVPVVVVMIRVFSLLSIAARGLANSLIAVKNIRHPRDVTCS